MLIPVAALAAILTGGIAVAATGVGGVRFKVAAPVTVQALGVNTSDAAVGQSVTAGVKLVAERRSTLSEVAIAVTAPDGKRADFPHATGFKLDTSQKVFSQTRSFDQVGRYTYWFTYKKQGRWIDLNPKQTFTVGGSGTPTTGPTNPPTPGATPSPSTSTGTTPTPGTTTAAPTTAPTSTGPTASPTSSPTSSANPSQRGCGANPGACGYPTPATTGVPAGTALRSFTGDYYARTAGQVIENMEINGCIWVQAPGVTIRNTRVRMADRCWGGIVTSDASGPTTIDRVEVACNYAHGTALGGRNVRVSRAYVHGCENAVHINSNSSIVDSYLVASEQGNPSAHGDGIQASSGSDMVIRHNTFAGRNPITSSIIMANLTISNMTVEDNFFSAGAYSVYCPANPTNVVYRNNRFYDPVGNWQLDPRRPAYGFVDGCNRSGITWTGNFRDTNGMTVSASG